MACITVLLFPLIGYVDLVPVIDCNLLASDMFGKLAGAVFVKLHFYQTPKFTLRIHYESGKYI